MVQLSVREAWLFHLQVSELLLLLVRYYGKLKISLPLNVSFIKNAVINCVWCALKRISIAS